MTLIQAITLSTTLHDLALDDAGNLYVVESIAVTHNHRIHKFDPTGAPITAWGSAGKGEGQFAFVPPPDGPPLHGGFIAVDEAGDVYVSDTFNNRVQKFDADGAFLGIWTSRDAEGIPFELPGPISTDRQGHIYVADLQGVYQFDLTGGYIRTLPAAGEVGVDSEGNLYSPIAFQDVVQKFDEGGVVGKTWGGTGRADGQFDFPLFLVVDGQDRIYVADHTGRVQQFDADGVFLYKWDEPGNGDAPFTDTVTIALDQTGNLYIGRVHRESIYVLRPA
jgi:outer membrane protein assembly factor BamB